MRTRTLELLALLTVATTVLGSCRSVLHVRTRSGGGGAVPDEEPPKEPPSLNVPDGAFSTPVTPEVKEIRGYVPPGDAIVLSGVFDVDFHTDERPAKPIEVTMLFGTSGVDLQQVQVLVVVDPFGEGPREYLIPNEALTVHDLGGGRGSVTFLTYETHALFAVITAPSGQVVASATPPPVPEGLALTAVSSSALKASWSPAPGAKGYVLAYAEDGGAALAGCASGTVVGESAIGAGTSLALGDLAPDTGYAVAVCAVGEAAGIVVFSRPALARGRTAKAPTPDALVADRKAYQTLAAVALRTAGRAVDPAARVSLVDVTTGLELAAPRAATDVTDASDGSLRFTVRPAAADTAGKLAYGANTVALAVDGQVADYVTPATVTLEDFTVLSAGGAGFAADGRGWLLEVPLLIPQASGTGLAAGPLSVVTQ